MNGTPARRRSGAALQRRTRLTGLSWAACPGTLRCHSTASTVVTVLLDVCEPFPGARGRGSRRRRRSSRCRTSNSLATPTATAYGSPGSPQALSRRTRACTGMTANSAAPRGAQAPLPYADGRAGVYTSTLAATAGTHGWTTPWGDTRSMENWTYYEAQAGDETLIPAACQPGLSIDKESEPRRHEQQRPRGCRREASPTRSWCPTPATARSRMSR